MNWDSISTRVKWEDNCIRINKCKYLVSWFTWKKIENKKMARSMDE